MNILSNFMMGYIIIVALYFSGFIIKLFWEQLKPLS